MSIRTKLKNFSPWIKEQYEDKKKNFKNDLIAGLIVAIVALPLALGFAIASNVPPAMGVYTAIVAGLFAALFGGSEYQVSGPTGAMVVVVLGVVSKHGVSGLVTATIIAGVILILMGLLKLGKIIEYIPSPVIVGFTAGIATIIFFGQLNNFFGISPSYPEGAEFVSKTFISLSQVFSSNWQTIILGILTIAVLIIMPKINRRIPGSIIAVALTTGIVFFFPQFFSVKTVSDIGAIPQSLPTPSMPDIDWTIIGALLPAAMTIAALSAIESLLSAVVADGMTGTRHKPNNELFGQGMANIASSLFGGMPATGAIARTATNIRNGAKTRVASIFHAVFLLIIIITIAPLAGMIPLACLAGILMFVAYNMVEWERISLIFKTPLSDVAVMVTTFLITVLVDLTTAIEVGLVLAALLFMKRMSDLYKVEEMQSTKTNGTESLIKKFNHPDISVYTINGPLFFGAASRFDQSVATTPGGHKPIKIIRMKYVPVIDATGLNFLESTYKKHRKMGGVVLFSTVHPDVMRIIEKSGMIEHIGSQHFFKTTRSAMAHALKHAHRLHKQDETVTEEELAKYDLTTLDLEEQTPVASTNDVDPVKDMLDSVGLIKVHKVGKKTIRKTVKIGKGTIGKTVELGIGTIEKTVDMGKDTIDKTMEIGKNTIVKTVKAGRNVRIKTQDKTKRALKRTKKLLIRNANKQPDENIENATSLEKKEE